MIHNIESLLQKAIQGHHLSFEEALTVYEEAPLEALVQSANMIRKAKHPQNEVGWLIDRNMNITNVCISGCKFCNFHCKKGDDHSFITSMEEYRTKIDELFDKGGDQLLLQGGMHPQLGLEYYDSLFRDLKSYEPRLKLHALGPPEVAFLAKKARLSHRETLERLVKAGLDSLPGAGAEILDNQIRKRLSPGKCSLEDWLNVMREAHRMNMVTSATMMYGHVETKADRIKHLIHLRNLQAEKPENSQGFAAFIAWPYMHKGTILQSEGIENTSTPYDYIRLVAISRLVLQNIENIQASWLTIGFDTAQLALHAGANDMGSIMIEENVVSKAGAKFSIDAEGIQEAIRTAGFIPRKRNQGYVFEE